MLERAPVLVQARTDTFTTWVAARRTVIGAWVISEAIVIGSSLALHWLHEPRGYFGPKIFSHALGPLETWDGVWDYIRANDVDYNPLHDQDYPSIGCTYCTRRVLPGEDLRAGRWAGSAKIECGLHAK